MIRTLRSLLGLGLICACLATISVSLPMAMIMGLVGLIFLFGG